jgi:hypothetical protein
MHHLANSSYLHSSIFSIPLDCCIQYWITWRVLNQNRENTKNDLVAGTTQIEINSCKTTQARQPNKRSDHWNQKKDLQIYLQWILRKRSVETVSEDVVEGRAWADVRTHFPETWFADTCAGLPIAGVGSETSFSLNQLHGGRRNSSAESGGAESEYGQVEVNTTRIRDVSYI